MTSFFAPPTPTTYQPPARSASKARRRFTTVAVVAAAMIAGGLGWRWALVEATTDYGPGLDSPAGEPDVRPPAKHSPPPVDLEVTVLDVHTAKATPLAAARVSGPPVSATKTRR